MSEEQFIASAIEALREEIAGKGSAQCAAIVTSYFNDEAPPIWNASVKQRVVNRILDGLGVAHVPAALPPPRSGFGERNPPAVRLHKSPYRFVTIPEGVVLAPENVRKAANDTPLPDGLCGKITVEWAFETPMLVGVAEHQGRNEINVPMRLGANGPYVIPGATLRSMTRAEMEIICRARLTQANKHHTYPLRDFTHSRYKDRTSAIAPGAASPINAGWLQKVNGAYTITPCDYRLIKIRDFLPALANAILANGKKHLNWLRSKLHDKYTVADMIDRDGHFYFVIQNDTFLVPPYANDCWPGTLGRNGVFVFSGPSPVRPTLTAVELDAEVGLNKPGLNKKRECVFFERTGAKAVPISDYAFRRFELMNCVPSQHGRKPAGTYEELAPTLEAGKRIPVFYTGSLTYQATLEIGLTRLFKIGHDFSLRDKLQMEAEHNPDPSNPDIVEALFGHVFEETDLSLPAGEALPRGAARKGRIAFGFATLMMNPADAATDGGDVTAVMMGPRASFAPFYLKGQYKDWSDPAARIAGRKRYFPRFSDQQQLLKAPAHIAATLTPPNNPANNHGQPDNNDMTSRLRFLEPKYGGETLNFQGTIRLHNVLPEEVGALLWSLTHGGDPSKPYRHMIGRAKNAGAGQVRIKSISLDLEWNDERKIKRTREGTWEVASGANEGWTSVGAQSLAPYLTAFDVYMKAQSGEADWPRVCEIQEFLGCSKPGAVPVAQSAYPALPNFKTIRDTTKHHQSQQPPSASKDDRYLETPKIEVASIVTPYL